MSKNYKEYWTNAPKDPKYEPINQFDLAEGVTYAEFVVELTPDSKECEELIKQVKGYVENLDDGPRLCYSQKRRYGTPGYRLLVPHMEERIIDIYEDLGIDVRRIYHKLSRKQKRKHYFKLYL